MPPVRPHPANGALVSAGPCRCRKLCRPCDLGISWMSPPRRLRRTTRRLVGGAGGAGSGTEPSGASHPTHGGVDAGGSAPHRRPAPPQATAAPRSAADPANSPNTEGSPLDNLAAEARVAEVDGWPRASNSAALQLDAVGAGGVAVALDGELVASLLRQGEQALVVEAAADAQRLLLEERLLIRCRCGQRPGQGAVGGTLLHVQVDLLALTAGKSVLVLGSRRLDVAGALVGPVLLDDVADLDATLLGGGYRPEPEAVGAGGVAVALDGELVASLLRQGEQALVVEAAADAQRLLLEERLLIRCRCGQRPGQGAVGGTLLHVQVDLLALTGGEGVLVLGSRRLDVAGALVGPVLLDDVADLDATLLGGGYRPEPEAVGAGGVAVALDGELVASLLRQGEQALVVEAAADAQRLLLEERLLIRCRCGQRPGQGAVGGTLLHVQVDLLALTAGKGVLVLGSRRLDVAGALVGPVLLDDVADLDATLLGGGYRPEPEAVGAGGVAVALDGELVASLLRQGEQALVVEAAADAQRLLLEERLLIRCRCGQRPGQ